MSTLSQTPAQVSFDAFAPHYDHFTAHHDYDDWIGTLEALMLRHGWQPGAVLDVACGTGKSAAPWLARGLPVTGCDVSEGMLRRARGRLGPDVELLREDMRALPRLGSFELVACLDDAVNYLADADELSDALGGMAANVAPGGLLLFDTNTVATYRSFYAAPTVVDDDDRVLIWHGRESAAFASGERALATLDAHARRQLGARALGAPPAPLRTRHGDGVPA
jgi:SAM-dependent methyltransferase